MIDTHCHLDVAAFDADRDEVLARAAAAGVAGVLVPAIRPRTWPALIELARARPLVRVALGVHPQIVPELAPGECSGDAGTDAAGDIDALAEQIAAEVVTAGAAAVGECGLDGGTGEPTRQAWIFRAHIRAARATRRPLSIHVLRAHDAAPRILREERAHEVGGVMHSYSGGAHLVPVYRDLGLWFSFAGPITYGNARRPVEAARAVPPDLLLVETDAPDQAPEPHRGGRCEPAHVARVVAGLAAARGDAPADLAALTAANAARVFGPWR